MLLHLSLERIFLAKERPVFLIKPIWKRLSLIIRCMYVLLSEMHFVEGYNNMFFREKWFFPTVFPVLISHAYLFLNGRMFCYFEARKMWLYLSPKVWEDYKLSNDRLNIDWNDNSLYTSTKRNVFFCPQNDHVTTESSLEIDSSYFSNPVESVSSSLSMN